MSLDLNVRGIAETATVVLSDTTATTLLEGSGEQDILVNSIAFASESGDTITLDTYDGSTAYRLAQELIGANGDGAYTTEFVLKRDLVLRGTLTTGNDTVVRVNYAILAT